MTLLPCPEWPNYWQLFRPEVQRASQRPIAWATVSSCHGDQSSVYCTRELANRRSNRMQMYGADTIARRSQDEFRAVLRWLPSTPPR